MQYEKQTKKRSCANAGGDNLSGYEVLGAMLSKRCNIGWTILGHTGEDVVFYSYLEMSFSKAAKKGSISACFETDYVVFCSSNGKDDFYAT